MKLKYVLFTALCVVLFSGSALAVEKPGKGVTVRPARATWNSGFFQEALVRRGLKELGYDVEAPKDLQNPIFYQAVTLGDIDYWTNGWFPMHDAQLPKHFEDSATTVGCIIKAGGLGGYLVSKRDVDKFHIKSLDDFKRDEVRKAFDTTGDGKADLTACPPGWGCEKIITHHMQVYGLKDDITPSKASYEAGMASQLANYKNGGPVFFYTWAPNWTMFKLQPGKDVMWINVPEINPTEAQKKAVDRMSVAGLEGAVSDPARLGFVASDIQVVANKKFLKNNPAAEKFFEVFTLPLEDINRQNARMNDGEKSRADIERHVDEWISKNKATWDGWLKAARKAAD